MEKALNIQSIIKTVYPPQCIACAAKTDTDFALCGSCWQETQFISGLTCSACGISLVGEDDHTQLLCDSCIVAPKPWAQGRAALHYGGIGRKLVLAFKHSDRTELAKPLARLMLKAGQPLFLPAMTVVPVPLFWQRLFRRKYNQAALLAQQIAWMSNSRYNPDVLFRRRKTPIQNGMSRTQRYENVRDAFEVHPKQRAAIRGASFLLVDDVMTSGATLSACSDVLLQAGAAKVNVLVLARVARDD